MTLGRQQVAARNCIYLVLKGFEVTIKDDLAEQDSVSPYIYFEVKICICRNLGSTFNDRSGKETGLERAAEIESCTIVNFIFSSKYFEDVPPVQLLEKKKAMGV